MHREESEQQHGGGGADVEGVVRVRPLDRGEPKQEGQRQRRPDRRSQVERQQEHQHHGHGCCNTVHERCREFRVVLGCRRARRGVAAAGDASDERGRHQKQRLPQTMLGVMLAVRSHDVGNRYIRKAGRDGEISLAHHRLRHRELGAHVHRPQVPWSGQHVHERRRTKEREGDLPSQRGADTIRCTGGVWPADSRRRHGVGLRPGGMRAARVGLMRTAMANSALASLSRPRLCSRNPRLRWASALLGSTWVACWYRLTAWSGSEGVSRAARLYSAGAKLPSDARAA